jgi:hypothetical protein
MNDLVADVSPFMETETIDFIECINSIVNLVSRSIGE